MFRPRIIPVLLLSQKALYKTVQFENPKYVGDPLNAVKLLSEFEADELVLLDIDRSENVNLELLQKISNETMMPFSYGGNIDSFEKAVKVFNHGAEKIIINSKLYENYNIISEIANVYGNQAIIASIDVRKIDNNYVLFSESGKKQESISLKEHIENCDKNGAGEILINSIDQDGTRKGYDLELIKMASSYTNLPVIACGGAHKEEDLMAAINLSNASAACAGSFFIYVGVNNAVLINYPDPEELLEMFNK